VGPPPSVGRPGWDLWGERKIWVRIFGQQWVQRRKYHIWGDLGFGIKICSLQERDIERGACTGFWVWLALT
jgi:hypothetical protein